MTSSQSLLVEKIDAALESVQSLISAENRRPLTTQSLCAEQNCQASTTQSLCTEKLSTNVETSTVSKLCEEKSEKPSCSICLEAEFDSESKLDGCGHHYCFECIMLWSRNTNTCPQCKSEFTTISRVDPSSASTSSRKRTRGEVNGVLKVKRRKQAAVYDEEELQRLGYIDDEAEDDDDDDDDEDDEENEDEIAGYSKDGFVVPNDVVEFDDDDESVVLDVDEEIGDDDSVDDEEDSDDEESDESTSSSVSLESEDDEIQIVKSTVNGLSVPIMTLRSRTVRTPSPNTNVRRSARISCMAN